MKPERIVVAGFGPVAATLIQHLAPAVADGRIELAVVGAEQHPAYNRVLLAEVATGAAPAGQLALVDEPALAASGIRILRGVQATGIDQARRRLHLDGAEDLDYDRLVLATGARPVIPTLGGLDFAPHTEANLPAGVHALRTVDDALAVQRVLAAGGKVLVLGGGVIGVETALALAAAGHRPVLLHHGPAPLGRMADADAGRLLLRELAAAGIEVISGARAEAIRKHHGRFTALATSTHGDIEADALLLATGVRPRTELASAAGLETGRGIITNRQLAVDRAGRIYALGDCAEVDGAPPAGLLAPGWAQAGWLAGHLLGDTAPPPRFDVPGLLMLKGQQLDLVAGGVLSQDLWTEDGTENIVYADPARGRYLKATLRAGKLEGFICLGLPATGAELALAYEQQRPVPEDFSLLLRLDDPAGGGQQPAAGPGDQLCRCSGATWGQVGEAVDEGAGSVAEVGERCRAGTGCGSCKQSIARLLAERVAAS